MLSSRATALDPAQDKVAMVPSIRTPAVHAHAYPRCHWNLRCSLGLLPAHTSLLIVTLGYDLVVEGMRKIITLYRARLLIDAGRITSSGVRARVRYAYTFLMRTMNIFSHFLSTSSLAINVSHGPLLLYAADSLFTCALKRPSPTVVTVLCPRSRPLTDFGTRSSLDLANWF